MAAVRGSALFQGMTAESKWDMMMLGMLIKPILGLRNKKACGPPNEEATTWSMRPAPQYLILCGTIPK
jgi:hypothetical protein